MKTKPSPSNKPKSNILLTLSALVSYHAGYFSTMAVSFSTHATAMSQATHHHEHSPNHSITTTTTISPVWHVTTGTSLSTYASSLRYEGTLDADLVHSRATKIKWSTARHGEGYDPTQDDPLRYMSEDDRRKEAETSLDDEMRPALVYSLAKRLSNQVFTSIVEKMPLEEARKVMRWKEEVSRGGAVGKVEKEYEGTLTDLEPSCHVKQRQEQEEDQNCTVEFSSLYKHYGIAYTFTLSLNTKPMAGLTPEEILERTTPDHRGWTKPIESTLIQISLYVESPDYRHSPPRRHSRSRSHATHNNSYHEEKEEEMVMAGNRAHVPRSLVEIQENNVQEIVEVFLMRSRAALGNMIPRNVERGDVTSQDVVVLGMPDFSQVLLKEEDELDVPDVDDGDGDEDEDEDEYLPYMEYFVIEDIVELCKQYKLTPEECLEAQEQMLGIESEQKGAKGQDSVTGSGEGGSSRTKFTQDEASYIELEKETEDLMARDLIADDLGQDAAEGHWDLSMDELQDLRLDLLSLDQLLNNADENQANNKSNGEKNHKDATTHEMNYMHQNYNGSDDDDEYATEQLVQRLVNEIDHYNLAMKKSLEEKSRDWGKNDIDMDINDSMGELDILLDEEDDDGHEYEYSDYFENFKETENRIEVGEL